MNRAQTICVVACMGMALLTATAGAETLLQQQIAQHERNLAQARSANSQRDVAVELTTLASLYRQAGDPHKGIDYCTQALAIERLPASQASTKNVLGRIYTDLGEEQRALDLYNEILPIFRQNGNRRGEAMALDYMGRTYNNLAQPEEAIKILNQALPIWREINYPAGEASSFDNMGRAYLDMGRGPEAIDALNKALPLWHEAGGESGGEAITLNNLGRTYADLGEKQKGLEYYGQSLAVWRQVGNLQGQARDLEFMGKVYNDLGQKQMALDYYNQALPLWRQTGNGNGEALALNDIGRAYSDMGQEDRALEFYNLALPVWHDVGNLRGTAVTLTNLGRSLSVLGQQERALAIDYQSLAAWRQVQDRRGESFALNTIGRVYSRLGQPQAALPIKLAALSLAKTAGDPELEGGIAASLMLDFRNQNRREEAIFFGTNAVNSFQQLRRNISGLDVDIQTGFADSKSATYRMLAELLVEEDRLGEAERVLDMLKEQELKEVVRGAADTAEAKVEPLPLTPAQQKAASELADPEKAAVALTDLSAAYAGLLAKTTRAPDEAAQLKTLEAKIEAGNGEVSDFFRKTLYPDLAQKAGTEDANALLSKEKSEVSRLQNTLAELGPRVMGVRLLLGDEHSYAIVVTAQARKKFELKATPAELRSKVLQVRDELRTPSSDPKPHLAELYAMVVAPIGDELSGLEKSAQSGGRAPTLLWSLDGSMRYLPMAALYDGRKYMVERFNNILFTPESYGHMAAPAAEKKAALRVLAMGLSKSYGGLPALPGVMPELNAVAHDPAVPESHGPMDGILLPNERFTYEALKTELGAGSSFPVVHIASHFVLEAGGGIEPYLMLGGESAGQAEGYPLTLSRLEDSTISFHGTRLLTLSACSTAKGDVAKDGMEMDSLGMIAQQKDAEAVLATLWDVNDASTSRIMSDFYSRWVKDPGDGKAEALRQAQLAFLHGSTAAADGGSGRGMQVEDAPAGSHASGYSHPFYWAPFVLIGNYQ